MKIYTYLLLLLLLITVGGCATNRNMATVRNSDEAAELFFNQQVTSQYNYYYYGPQKERPIALLALDKSFSIKSEFWTSVDIDETTLQQWQGYIRDRTYPGKSEFRGKEIVSPRSETIGMVYSRYHWVTAWFDTSDTTRITIPPPELSGYQPRRDRKQRNEP